MTQTDAVPEVQEQGSPLDADIELQRQILGKIKEVTQKGRANRMAEVQNARDQRLYFRGTQQFYWSEQQQDVIFDTEDDSPYDRTFNVYQGYGKIFVSTFLGARGKSRPEADDPFNPASIRATRTARTWERVYEKFNNPARQQMELGRLMFTDGRIITRTVDRGGRTITEFWGVLESRLPATIPVDEDIPLKHCDLIQLEKEYRLNELKAAHPDVRGKINSGNGDSYERNARIAVMRQAGSDTGIDTLSGEDNLGLGTKTITIMRPAFYEEFSEVVRTQLEEMFPAGLSITHSGDVYLESEEYDFDAHLDVLHAMPGDGMSRPSIGASLMPLQDSVNTGMNLAEDIFDHGIPTTYYDKATNIDGLNQQENKPGASRKMLRAAGDAAKDHFFETAAVNPPEQLMEYMELVRGPLAQFVSGQQPALFGGQMQDQKTASGYAQARSMALGQMAIVWIPYTNWLSREKTRAVKLDASRTDELATTLAPQRAGGQAEAVRIIPGELQGVSFTNVSDENFPETWTERSNKFMNLLQTGGPLVEGMLQQEPDNLYLAKEMTGLEDLVIPGEDIRNNVLSDIARMEHEPPVPDPNAMPQQLLPAPGQPPPQVPLVSSVQADTEYFDPPDFAIAYRTVKHWIYSPAGQEAKTANPPWFQNVRLYGQQYKQGMIAAEQASQPAPVDLPKVQIPYDSLPVDGKIQAAGKAGIQITPQDVASVPPKNAPAMAG